MFFAGRKITRGKQWKLGLHGKVNMFLICYQLFLNEFVEIVIDHKTIIVGLKNAPVLIYRWLNQQLNGDLVIWLGCRKGST